MSTMGRTVAAWMGRATLSFALVIAAMGCSPETSQSPVGRSVGAPGQLDRAKDIVSAGSIAKTTCFNENGAEVHMTAAGPLRIVCDPNVGWSTPPTDTWSSDVRSSYAPYRLTLNGELLLENITIRAELGKKKDGFEYWLIHAGGLEGNACSAFTLLAVGKTGHQLYDDLHNCQAWERRQPDLTFAGLNVRDDTPAIDRMCEPYLKVVPPHIKVRHAEALGNFVKHSDPALADGWLQRVPTRFHHSSYLPFGCQINDYDGVIVVYLESDLSAGYGLYLTQKQAYPERN